MERTALGGYTSQATVAAEERADRLAWELLAPAADAWAAISASLEANDRNYAAQVKHSVRALREQYGLPSDQAQEYARWLLKNGGHGPGVRDWLGLIEG